MNFTISPLVWAIAGFVLIIIEVLHLSLVLLFFGIAALIVAGVAWAGLTNATLQIILFAILGLSGVFLFRKKLQHTLEPSKDMSADRNKSIVLSADIPAKGSAPIQYQGSTWTAMNDSDHELKQGTRVFIQGTEGVKLIIKETPL